MPEGTTDMNKPRVAIIGGGIAGIAAAHYLQDTADILLFEKNDYVGGHTNTIVIEDGEDEGLAVDTGFIVLNDKTYPLLHALFREWGVQIRNSDMSFGFYCEASGIQYAGTGLRGLFADPKRLFDPGYYAFLSGIWRFGKQGLLDCDALGPEVTLGEYLDRCGYSQRLIQDYIIPMGAAIWSTPSMGMQAFPAETFLSFFRNHGLLNLRERPQWQTVQGGSFQYVKAFLQQFSGQVQRNAPVVGVRREEDKVLIRKKDGTIEDVDQVIFAVHADHVLGLLDNPSTEEEHLFSVWRYQANRAILHTDTRVLPPRKAAHASWNYRREAGTERRLSLTYDMNRLQGFTCANTYCVTLNSKKDIADEHVIKVIDYAHPLFNREALESRERLQQLNGQQRTWYCGSYFRYGFHEDAVYSASQLATRFREQLLQSPGPEKDPQHEASPSQ